MNSRVGRVAWRCLLFVVRGGLVLTCSFFQVGDVIAKSDYILVAAALTPETIGMVGAAELARVRFCSVLITHKKLLFGSR